MGMRGRESVAVDCPKTAAVLRKNAEKVARNAEQARTPLHKFSKLWCDEATTAKISFDADNIVMGPQKGVERIQQKAVARYGGDVFQVSDAVRNRILIDDPSQLKALKSAISNKSFVEGLDEKNGIKILSVEDRFENPTATHWRGFVVKTEIDLGKGRTQLAETVVMPRGWVEDYEKTHVYLEHSRELTDLAQAQDRDPTPHEKDIINKNRAEARAIHDYLAHTDGYAHLEIAKPQAPASGAFARHSDIQPFRLV